MTGISNTPALFIDGGDVAVTVKRLAYSEGRPVGESVLDILAEPGSLEILVRVFAAPPGLRALAAAITEAADLIEAAPEGEKVAVVKAIEWRPMDL
jgi:hypothetical protein